MLRVARDIKDILNRKQLSTFRGTPEGHLGGGYVRRLEEVFCDYFNIKYAVAMNSATSCLHAAMVACNLTSEDEVIVSPYSFSSSASCVLMVGAKPVFADIQDDIYCINPKSALKVLTMKTKAIIPVHLFGHPADMNPIMETAGIYGLKVIEDCAQAITAKYKGQYVGTIGDCGIFSFNQSKHINTGEGGILITNDDYIAKIARAIRNHGEVADPELGIVGFNYRMCEIEACLAIEQFKWIDDSINWRIEKAGFMDDYFADMGIKPAVVYDNCKHVYYIYAIRHNKPIYKFTQGYVQPLYMLPIYHKFGYGRGLCPVTEAINKEIQIINMGGG